jgi:hypothetical protein
METGASASILRDAAKTPLLRVTDECVARRGLRGANKNEQAIRVSPNRLLVEDLTAFGYPRPAPLLAAGDHVFFEDRTAGAANRSTALIYFHPRI